MFRTSRLLLLCAGFVFALTARAQASAPLVFLGDKNLPPYEFLERGVPKGANVDLANAIGRMLGRPVVIELKDWSQAQADLLAGRGDALTMLGRTPEREQQFRFTAETMPVQFTLFVRSDEETRFTRTSMAGVKVGVARAGLGRTLLLAAHPAAVPVDIASNLEGIAMLLRREIDALAAQEWSVYYQLRELGTTSITGLPAFHARNANIALRISDQELAGQIDAALRELKAKGEFERILDHWSSTRVRTVSEATISVAAAGALAAFVVLGALAGLALLLRQRGQVLKMQVEERMRVEAELRQAKDALEISDRRKDRFLATLSHELRGPLAPISNAMLVLEKSQASLEKQQWARKVVQRQLHYLVRLMDDLLDISRINAGTMSLHIESMALEELLAEVVESQRPAADGAKLGLTLSVPDGSTIIVADRTRLLQVFTNLLTNAIRYTPSGGAIFVELKSTADAAWVVVRDTGVGLEPAAAAQVFEMFYRDEQAVRLAPGGLGLGLWLCQRIVEAHAGSIRAESLGAGKGASFIVSLPLLQRAA